MLHVFNLLASRTNKCYLPFLPDPVVWVRHRIHLFLKSNTGTLLLMGIKLRSKRLGINGIVQGVGFRPFVYQLAQKYRLKGEVSNTATGVNLVIEGATEHIDALIRDLTDQKPPLARIVEIDIRKEPVKGFTTFSIVKSRGGETRATLISPDVSVCNDCLDEMRNPNDRRYGYPFINCTNCGPRYTIIDDVPYDRPKTSMASFKMCDLCQAEYDDPDNRRFHAQPNACSVCGPKVTLYNQDKTPVETADPVTATARLIQKGHIVAVKGLGGFHLVVDATDNDAVARLRKRKHREEKPFAVMSPDVDQVRRYAIVHEDEKTLLTAIQKPIVLLEKKEPHPLADQVSPDNKYCGVMLPYTPLHYLLLEQGFTALVMTSGNISEEPIAIDNEEAFKRLYGIADFFLVHDRDIYLRSDDSIVRRCSGKTRFIRRSRGYVPVPVFLKNPVPEILACGAELKNTVCLTKGKNAFVSQHIGDLENLATDQFFRLTIRHLKRILDIAPEIVACDLHPDYMSTQYALSLEHLHCVQVQHHHAHIAAGMAENHIGGPVIGLSFDGTGLGTDGAVWGGEVLITDHAAFSRAAHLAYVPMPGSASAIKEPWRMAVGYLYDAFGDKLWDLDLPLLKRIDARHLQTMVHMAKKGLNAPLTSSLGRLFDGVAALVGIRDTVAFEGQAAMLLEMCTDRTTARTYDYQWIEDDPIRILTAPIITGVVKDMTANVPIPVISGRFHATLVEMFTRLCCRIRKMRSLNTVVLSGGVFQNAILLAGMIESLEKNNFNVYTHKRVPANDGGIALGQAVVAAARADQTG